MRHVFVPVSLYLNMGSRLLTVNNPAGRHPLVSSVSPVDGVKHRLLFAYCRLWNKREIAFLQFVTRESNMVPRIWGGNL